jgi:hypothetical protein
MHDGTDRVGGEAYLQAVRAEVHFRPVNAPQGQVLRAQTLQGVPCSCHNGSTRHLDEACLVEARQEAWQGQRPLLLLCLLLLWSLLLWNLLLQSLLLWSLLLWSLLLQSLLLWRLLHILPADQTYMALLHRSSMLLLLLLRLLRRIVCCRGSAGRWGCCIVRRCSLVVLLLLLLLYRRWLSVGACTYDSS